MSGRKNGAGQAGAMLAAAGIGAAMMYFLDPARGARRRAVATDKAQSFIRSGAGELERRGVQARDHLTGLVARTRARLGVEEPTDVQLAERVRAALGHHSGHVRALETVVQDGIVTLRGTLPAGDLREVLRAVRRVRGVRGVQDELNVQEPGFAAAGQSPVG